MKMNKYVKEFLHRGLMFSGFGPVIYGIIALFEPAAIKDGKTVLVAIVSTYILAFLQAGVSVYNMVESWSLIKIAFLRLAALYVIYLSCYLLNSWLPFDVMNIVWFSVIFVLIYVCVWFIVYFSVRKTSKTLNKNLK